MIYPSIDKMLNIVGSKYLLVNIIAIRAKQMQETNHYQLATREYHNKRELGRSLEELEKGLITYKYN